MSNITNIHAREILDSRGTPTIEVELTTADGQIGFGSVPSGASTGEAEAMDLLVEAIDKAGYRPGEQIALCFDAATSEFYDKEKGVYRFDGDERTGVEMADYYEGLLAKYPIISMEDPFEENAWDDFAALTARIGDKMQIVGDDIFVTNPKRLQRAIDEKTANSLLVKLNQIGTVSETLDAMNLAYRNGFTTMVSHRSGETPDATIADLTVGMNAMQLKSGAPARGERIAKYNQLLRIEERLGGDAQYAGAKAFPRIAAK
ncbi:hypothetical protein [Bifidobacterium sp.]|jgi:enolase|uniref:hypothetical protein n=1 Tax=Bifidobacterium sp. TaxID=41200 RepID=UPI0025BB48AD|nr:hypothetical protein [Bifidobacterium sp.]